MGKSHAVSGASLWLASWSLASIAGVAHPRADVLVVGTLVTAGAAIYNDIDHPSSRIARAGSRLTWAVAKSHAWAGRLIHEATKTATDRPDKDGHRTITHTLPFAAFVGVGAALLGIHYGRVASALTVWFFVTIGITAMLAGSKAKLRNTKIRLFGRARVSRASFFGVILGVVAYFLVPGNTWWLGLAVGAGCVIHCLGDCITASGCPILWPIPIPVQRTVYVRGQGRVPVRKWQTWYLVGTPQWMRFRVDTRPETIVTWGLVVLAFAAAAGLVYAGGQPA